MQTQAIPLHCNTEAEPAHYDLVYKLTQISELISCNYTLVTKRDACTWKESCQWQFSGAEKVKNKKSTWTNPKTFHALREATPRLKCLLEETYFQSIQGLVSFFCLFVFEEKFSL